MVAQSINWRYVVKRIIVGLVGVALTVVGLAVTQAQGSEQPSVCESSWTLAYNVMKMRQDDTPKAIVESVIYTDFGQEVVDKAYGKAIVPANARRLVSKHYADVVQHECEVAQEKSGKTVAI